MLDQLKRSRSKSMFQPCQGLPRPNRLNGHAEDRGRACTIDGYDIAFDVWSQTNACAASDLVRIQGRQAWGVLYEIPDECIRGERTDQQKTLTKIEGPRYHETVIRVRNSEGEEVNAVTFVVREADRRTGLATSAAYVSWIVYGLRDHGVPEEYITHVLEAAIENNERARERAASENKIIKTL